jgi:O-antigen/teichoic acid export membrane protein
MLQFAMSPLSTLMVLRGHTRAQNYIVWFEFAIFVVGSLLLVSHLHLIGLVWARICATVANAVLTALCVRAFCKVSIAAMVQALWRPVVGAVGMYWLVVGVLALLPLGGQWNLLLGVVSGAIAYTVWILATWIAVGKPEGLESTMIDYLGTLRA